MGNDFLRLVSCGKNYEKSFEFFPMDIIVGKAVRKLKNILPYQPSNFPQFFYDFPMIFHMVFLFVGNQYFSSSVFFLDCLEAHKIKLKNNNLFLFLIYSYEK